MITLCLPNNEVWTGAEIEAAKFVQITSPTHPRLAVYVTMSRYGDERYEISDAQLMKVARDIIGGLDDAKRK